MSSKSKKKTPPADRAPHGSAHPVREPEAAGAHPAGAEHGLDERVEEVLYVPKGRKPLSFALTIVAVIVLTVMFAINPGTCQSATRGPGGAVLTWTDPAGETRSVGAEWYQEKRLVTSVRKLYGVATSAEDTAIFLVLDSLARASGVQVTDDQLAQEIRARTAQLFNDRQGWYNYARRENVSVPVLEEGVRRFLRIELYKQLMAQMGAQPSAEQVLEVWRRTHQERAYDWTEVLVADFLDDARAEVPDDAALEAWLGELDELRRMDFEEPARLRAELVGFLFDGDTDAAGLLARFPDAGPADDHDHDHEEGEEHDRAGELAQAYYGSIFFYRFKKPADEGAPPPTDFLSGFFSFEEVEEQARREAPVYFALEAWLEELTAAEAGETPVDLEAEAAALGLVYRPATEALTVDEWADVQGFGGATLGNRIARLTAGGVTPTVSVEEGGMSIARLAERTEAYQPEFAAIRDRVAEAWIADRAEELALERLGALRDGFAKVTPEGEQGDDAELVPEAGETEFAEAAAAAGLAVSRRPFMEAATAVAADPDADLPGHLYIRTRSSLASLEPGQLSEPGLSADGERAFLVRCAGSRAADEATMSPGELAQAERTAYGENARAFGEANFSFPALEARFGAALASGEREE